MSSFLSWLPESGSSRLLCDALWQSTLIAAVGCVASRFLTRQSAARAWLLLLTLTACLLVPLASLAARESGWTVVTHPSAGTWPRLSETRPASAYAASFGETRPRDFAANETILASHPKAAPATATEAVPGQSASARNATIETFALNALGIVWLTASALLTLRLALSCLATVRLIRRAAACGDAELIAAGATAAQRVGPSRSPALLISHDVRTPTVFALGRPRLLIPTDGASRAAMKNIDWTAAFTHELAHAARRDAWARLWVEIVLIALPLQPLVWLARRAFHSACEEACDDWAVATGSDPVDLADMLTAWIHLSKPKPTLLAIGMSSTKSRTLRLLALRTTPTPKLARRWRWAGACAGVLLVAGLAVAQSPLNRGQAPSSPMASAASKGESKEANDTPTASSGKPSNPPLYVIEPPDVVTIALAKLVPKEIWHIQPQDKVHIQVVGTPKDQPIGGVFEIDGGGDVVLGPQYGSVRIIGMTRSQAQETVKKKLEEVLKEPQVALTIDESGTKSEISGDHLVALDGTISLGSYGRAKVGGLTIADARAAVEKKLSEILVDPNVAVDVSKFSSKSYYVIVGDCVRRLTTTGHDTVMDAISDGQNSGFITLLPIKSISIARPSSAPSKRETLEVLWKDVLHGDDTTNYQILPGDRIFIEFEQPSGGGGAIGRGGPATEPSHSATKPTKP
jgi:polysaccharide export outer membrane protein